ncbi:hypothetical protein FACS1894107_17050 [Planctomycetales bacterium]|nr:hypothetical protein FACS1894107_17050 [Planctomycetales bacterium]
MLANDFHIRMTPEEKSDWCAAANVAGLTVSEFVRRCCAGRTITARADVVMVNELRRLGGLLKHIHHESGGANPIATADALTAITDYIKKLSGKNDCQKNHQPA